MKLNKSSFKIHEYQQKENIYSRNGKVVNSQTMNTPVFKQEDIVSKK